MGEVAQFRYEAVEPSGSLTRGVLEAADVAGALALLRRDGRLPLRAEPAGRGRLADLLQIEIGRGGALRAQEVADFTRELSLMLGAGQDLDRAMGFLVDTAAKPRVRRVLAAVRDAVRDGSGLAAALARQERSFPRLYIGLVRAGEAGGTMAATLEHMATLLERERCGSPPPRLGRR